MSDARRSRWIIAAAAVVTIGVTAALGVWQLRRGEQRQTLADAIRDRAAMPALASLPAVRPTLDDPLPSELWHRRVTLRGRWVPQHTVYLDNRQMAVQGAMRVGFEVLTPLQLSDGTAVVVQRGWVARDFADRARLPSVATPNGPVVVEGRYAPPPPRLYEFKTDDNPLARLRQNLDIDAFAQETGLSLRPGSVVQLGGDEGDVVAPPTAKLQRAWSLPDSGVAKHHGYAFQWFGLSLLTAGLWLWFQLIAPRRARARAANEGAYRPHGHDRP